MDLACLFHFFNYTTNAVLLFSLFDDILNFSQRLLVAANVLIVITA